MGLSKMEQEITIGKIATEDMWDVYSCDPKYIRKLEKVGLKAYKEDTMEGEVIGKFFKVPEKMICIRSIPKRKQLTEEERNKVRERFANHRKSLSQQ